MEKDRKTQSPAEDWYEFCVSSVETPLKIIKSLDEIVIEEKLDISKIKSFKEIIKITKEDYQRGVNYCNSSVGFGLDVDKIKEPYLEIIKRYNFDD